MNEFRYFFFLTIDSQFTTTDMRILILILIFQTQELDQILEKERLEIEKVQKEVDLLDSDNEDLTEEQLDELEAQVGKRNFYLKT